MEVINTNELKSIYTDEYLLNRLFSKLNAKTQKSSALKPDLERKNGKVMFINFCAFCESIERDQQSVKKFIEVELKKDSSILPSGALIIDKSDKSTTDDKLMIMLERYMTRFVLCQEKNCKAMTEIVKEDRITYLICKQCHSKKAI
jgi:translation initiation factor 2 beta subunit (eIF-2beta)/eIF-5